MAPVLAGRHSLSASPLAADVHPVRVELVAVAAVAAVALQGRGLEEVPGEVRRAGGAQGGHVGADGATQSGERAHVAFAVEVGALVSGPWE